ncbi:MAG: hypothetical protein LUD53_00395 [Clostridiales bacterium]|nr:hypothetical protein [Clostridiales bacterium]
MVFRKKTAAFSAADVKSPGEVGQGKLFLIMFMEPEDHPAQPLFFPNLTGVFLMIGDKTFPAENVPQRVKPLRYLEFIPVLMLINPPQILKNFRFPILIMRQMIQRALLFYIGSVIFFIKKTSAVSI